MPGRLRRLSGSEVVAGLTRLGFWIVARRGSHAKLRRIHEGEKQTLVVPLHDELDTGTLRTIARQASRYVTREELRALFYDE